MDSRGSVHVFETILVGVMVAGAVVAVATFSGPDDNPHQNLLPQDPRMTQDVLDVAMELPTQSTHIHYTNRLEELIVEHLVAEADPHSIETQLVQELRRHQNGANHRLQLHVDGHRLQITGHPEAPETNPSSATAMWNSQLGTTLIQPTMSHHDPAMAVHHQLLPVWADRIPHPAGHPYEISLELEADDAPALKHTTHAHYREPRDDQTILRIEPVDAQGDPQALVTPGLLDLGLNATAWDVHFQLQAHQDHDGPWLHQETVLRLHRPPGWDPPEYNESRWQRQNDENEPLWELRYIGTPRSGEGAYWFNLTLKRPTLDPPMMMHPLTVQADGESWSQASVLLGPIEVLNAKPLSVYPNIPHPIPVNGPAPLTFLVTNSDDEERTLSWFQLRFPDAAHRFKHEPNGWQRDEDAGNVVYTLETAGNIVLEPHGVARVVLPMKLEKPDGNTVLQAHPPILEHLGAGEQTPPTIDGYHGDPVMTSLPHGARGQYLAWSEPQNLQPGTHTVRVPHNGPMRIPPGVGTYERTLDPHPFLRELQETRDTMHLEVTPEQIRPGEPVTVRLDTAELLPLLRQSPSLNDDRVRVTITTSDLIGRITGTHEAQIEYDLDLDWNAEITGIAWMPTDTHQGLHDLVVGYSDGRLVRLDGTHLPNQTHWRQTLSDTITAGPYWLAGDDENDGRIAVFTRDRIADPDQLLLLDADGDVQGRLTLDGNVHQAIRTDCQDGPTGIAFLVSGTAPGLATAVDITEHTALTGVNELPLATWTRLDHYQNGDHRKSESWTAARPADLTTGQYGPRAECSVLAAINDPLGDGRLQQGHVHRYSLESWEDRWHQTIPGGIASIHTTPFAGTPHYDGYLNEDPIERLVVVNTTGTWRVHGAWTHDAATNGQLHWQEIQPGPETNLGIEEGPTTMPGLPPGDTLLGMSWANHTTGYLASKGGMVWKTEDAGNAWGLMEESPIVGPGQEIVDFAFGGDGTGVFLNNEGDIRFYQGSFGNWDSPNWNPDYFHGLTETSDGPGFIEYDAFQSRTELLLVSEHSSKIFLECNCKEVFGHDGILIGWDDATVYYNTTEGVSGTLTKSGVHYMAQASGHVLELRDDDSLGLAVHLGLNETLVNLDSEVAEALAGSLNPTRNPFNAFMTYDENSDKGVVALDPEGLPINIPAPRSDIGVVGLSGGLGQVWWVFEDTIFPMSAPDKFLFEIEGEISSSDTVELRLAKGTDGTASQLGEVAYRMLDPETVPSGVQWRILSPDDTGPWTQLNVPSGLPEGDQWLVEVKWPAGQGFPIDSPALVTNQSEDATVLFASSEQECTNCLVPIGDRRILDAGGPLWLDPEGHLTGNTGEDWNGGGLLVEDGKGAHLVGVTSEDPWSHNVSLGLPWRVLETPYSMGGESGVLAFYVVEDPEGDILVGEKEGSEPTGGWLTDDGSIGLRSTSGVLYHLDPETGDLACTRDVQDWRQNNPRVLQHHPISGYYAMGGGFGQLSAVGSSSCNAKWESEALETGAVLHTTVPSSRSPLPGPVVVDVAVTLDVEVLDEVQLHFLGHSFRSTYDAPVSPVWMNAHLQYWLPRVHGNDGFS